MIERGPWEVFEAGGRALSDDFMSKRVPPPLEMTCLLDPDTLIFMVRALKIVTPKNEPHRERLRAAGKVAAHCRRRQLLGHGQQGERFVAGLEIPPVDSPLTAVKVSIVSDIKSGKLKAS